MKTALFSLVALSLLASVAHAQQDPYPLPPKEWPKPVMDTEPHPMLLLDLLEYRSRAGKDAWVWEGEAWFGGDYNKLWIKSEGESEIRGSTASADLQALYARRIAPFWYLQAGVRQEMRPRPVRNQGVLAVQGLAPYWFNVQASAFIGDGGLSGRLEAEYDQLLTQRLILQPRVETNFAGSSNAARGVGSGINDVELGLRLRYEIRREFAPYVGVTWTRKVGDTADLARQQGHDVKDTAIVLGLRAWY